MSESKTEEGSKFNQLKSILLDPNMGLVPDEDILEEERSGFATLLGSLRDDPDINIQFTFYETIEKISDLDSQKYSESEKYFLLLVECKKHYEMLSKHLEAQQRGLDIEKSQMKQKLSEILGNSRIKFDNVTGSPVEKSELAFVHLYLLSKNVLGEENILPLFKEVAQGSKSIDKARNEIEQLAYAAYAQPNLTDAEKQNLIKVLITKRDNLITDNRYKTRYAAYTMAERCLSLEDVILYKARATQEPQYNMYLASLRRFSQESKKPRDHLSAEMNTTLDRLTEEANKLYLDEKENSAIKSQCQELLTHLAAFKDDIAKIRSVHHFKKPVQWNDTSDEILKEADRPPTHDVKSLSESVVKQAEQIEKTIDLFSKNTSSLRWGRILLIAIVTLGIGLLAVKPSLDSGSRFFKNEIPIIERARKLVDEGKVDIKAPDQTSDQSQSRDPKLEF